MGNAKIVLLRARAGAADGLETTLRALVRESGREDGNEACLLHRCEQDGDRFMVYERWRDEAAFAAHMATPHVAAFLRDADALLAAPAEVLPFALLR